MTRAKCLFCGGKASLLCDTSIGWERKRGELAEAAPHLLNAPSHCIPLRYRTRHACDAPLCDACAVPAGVTFCRVRYLGRFAETTDYCPGHDRGDLRQEITGLAAQAFRARWRASVRGARERDSAQPGLFSGLVDGGRA